MVAAFPIGPGPLVDIANPTPLSLPGNIARFGTGVALAILWQIKGGNPANVAQAGDA